MSTLGWLMCVLEKAFVTGGGPENGEAFTPFACPAAGTPLVPIPMPRPEDGPKAEMPAWAARPEPTVAAPKGLRDAMAEPLAVG